MQNTPENIFLAEPKEGEASHLIIDESLETQAASICDILVAIESDSINLALKEKKTSRILALESFQLKGNNNIIKWPETLEQISRNSHLLRNFEFTKAIVGVFPKAYTLIPDAMFKGGDESKFLEFNFKEEAGLQKVFSRPVTPFNLKTIFGIGEELHHEIFHLFENPILIHLSSSLLEAAHLQLKGKKEREIFLNIRKSNIDIIVLEGKKLLLMNSYQTQTADEVLYFSLLVCDQLELDPETITIQIAGDIEKESAKYKMLYQYFRNLQFATRPGNIKYSYRLDKLPSYQYFSLFSLALCES